MVFKETSYRTYLNIRLGQQGQRSGAKSAAAKAIGCHTTYLSAVLAGRADLSLEQAHAMSEFLGHTKDESQFFLLLVSKERAGTPGLKKHFQEEIEASLAKRTVIKNRIQNRTQVSPEDEARFYSTWAYGAVHVLVSIPALQTRTAVAAYLKMSPEKAAEILDFLEQIGMVERKGERYQHSLQMVHLGNDSHSIVKHHLNWRLRAMRALEESGATGTHYSAAVSLSKADAARIKQILVENLQRNLEIIGGSKEEVAYGYAFDFFELKA